MLIGLTGYAQHGKDSAGRVLVEEFGFRRYAFADQLKEMALVLNPIIPERVEIEVHGKHRAPYKTYHRLWTVVQDRGWDGAKRLEEVRRFLQVLGTEAVRDFLGEDSWVRALEKRAREDWVAGDREAPYLDRVVVTDVRFPNEAEWVHESGGELWRITRPGHDNGLGTDHPSEAHVAGLPTDAEVSAITLEDLRVEVWKLAAERVPIQG